MLITSVTVDGLVPCSVTGVVDGVQVELAGNPELHEMEIEAVNCVSGVS